MYLLFGGGLLNCNYIVFAQSLYMNSAYTDRLPKFLSPSRAKDFMQCPQLFYFKTILGLKTPPTKATLKGTLAHHAFEHIFDHEPSDRTVSLAVSYVKPAWEAMVDPFVDRNLFKEGTPGHSVRTKLNAFADLHELGSESYLKLKSEADEFSALFSDGASEISKFLFDVEQVVLKWFSMENPQKFTPLYREKYLNSSIGKAPVHGYIDRIDLITNDTNDSYYISDYKTGKMPSLRFQDDAFFQLGLYALLLQNYTGYIPKQIRLIYVNEGRQEAVLTKNITPEYLALVKGKIESVWSGITKAANTDSFKPKPQVLCDWCHFKDICPAFSDGLSSTLPEEIEFRANFLS